MSIPMLITAIRSRIGSRKMRRYAFVELVMPPAYLAGVDRDELCAGLAGAFRTRPRRSAVDRHAAGPGDVEVRRLTTTLQTVRDPDDGGERRARSDRTARVRTRTCGRYPRRELHRDPTRGPRRHHSMCRGGERHADAALARRVSVRGLRSRPRPVRSPCRSSGTSAAPRRRNTSRPQRSTCAPLPRR